VRAEYDKRLCSMTKELQQLVSASKQHIVTVRNHHSDQKQLDDLHREIEHMNKMKVSFCAPLV